MADLLYVLIMVGFFALAAGFVVACERIIGSTAPYDAQRDSAASPPAPEGPPARGSDEKAAV